MTARIEWSDGTPVVGLKLAARWASFDARANRALRGTVTGESMADWGPEYIKQAKAILRLPYQQGRLYPCE